MVRNHAPQAAPAPSDGALGYALAGLGGLVLGAAGAVSVGRVRRPLAA